MSSHTDLANVWQKPQSFRGQDHYGLRLNNLTTTQRDALTGSGAPFAGAAIFNTTTGQINVYSGSAWLPDGTAGTVTTSETTVAHEGGDGVWHQTQLTMTAFSLGNVGDAASLGIGAKFYTFPDGELVVKDMVLAGLFSAAVSDTAQTPEYGVGSTIGTGVIATLSTTLETYIDGGAAGGMVGGTAVLADLTGAVVHAKSILAANTEGFWIKASGGLSHDLFLNAADAWDDVTTVAPLLFTGKISFRWRLIT
jgi:hypothetical protein